MAVPPVIGAGTFPVAFGNSAAPRGNADIAVSQVAIQAQARTLRRELDQAAENAPDTLNQFGSSPTYDMRARVAATGSDGRRRGHLVDQRV